MRIGEFADRCRTKISVLRHYDKLGLLRPVYVDRFTGYRCYAGAQTSVFEQIQELKRAGLSLDEIGQLLQRPETSGELFDAQKKRLMAMLDTLGKLQENFQGGLSMNEKIKPYSENIDLPFEDDREVVGRWQTVTTGDTPDSDSSPTFLFGDSDGVLYFLPEGRRYWCFGWTKGKLLFDGGDVTFTNDYRTEHRQYGIYMTVDFKSPDYGETGDTIPVTLKKLDSKEYTAEEIARKDNIDIPFRPDDRVLGKWVTFCYFDPSDVKKEDFVPYENPPHRHAGSRNYDVNSLYLKEIEFDEDGHLTQTDSDETISDDSKATWTKGYILRKWNSCALSYEIKVFDGREYLIVEWKSGDYRWGGRPSSYYVLVR